MRSPSGSRCRWSTVLVPGLLLAAAGVGLGCLAQERGRHAGEVEGTCRTRFLSGVPGDPNPVGPWKPLPDLRIVVLDEAGKEVASATSGPGGRYRLTLPPGRYSTFAVQANTRYPPARVGGREAPDNRVSSRCVPGARSRSISTCRRWGSERSAALPSHGRRTVCRGSPPGRPLAVEGCPDAHGRV